MKKLVLASVSALALFGVVACSDTDNTTTQGTNPPAGDTGTTTTTPPAASPDTGTGTGTGTGAGTGTGQ